MPTSHLAVPSTTATATDNRRRPSLHKLWRRSSAWALLYLSVLHLVPAESHADGRSGTWTGALQGALHYYYERSTRVFMPEVQISVESPSGERLRAGYLLDVITSASVFAGASDDRLSDEYRHAPVLGLGKTFNLDDFRLSADATAQYSRENDYESFSAYADVGLYLNSDNSIFHLGVGHLRDRIFTNPSANFRGNLTGWSSQLTYEQVLNPLMVLTMGYQFGHQEGYLGNAYRKVGLQAAEQMEQPPSTRFRHGLSGRLAIYVPPAELAVHLLSRVYIDSWDVKGITPEIRLYKELGPWLMLRLRYRFYAQTPAEFYRRTYPRDWEGPFTGDYKLAPLHSHTLGFRVDFDLGALEQTPLGFISDSTIYLSLNRVLTNHFYGNETVGTGGGILRF